MKKNSFELLSHILSNETPSYGDRDSLEIIEKSSIKSGNTANSSEWNFSINHIGTHIDVPKHFYDDGLTITDYHISEFIFNSPIKLDIPRTTSDLIEYSEFKKSIPDISEVILIKTGYEKYRGTEKYWNDNPGISPDCASQIRNNHPNIKAIGFDFISLTSWTHKPEGRVAHQNLLSTNDNTDRFIIIEDLSLLNINNQQLSKLFVIPLFVKQANGSPATVFCEEF
ncbi:MAG: cyclase family protein [Melioribacteraceae bacterium]|nr:cyclase family protein [Melioribacteraceae bacterium]